jgi:transposase
MQDKSMLNDKTLIYDLTSTYFEKTKCTIAFKGYSRDHRPDKLQIVIAMAVTSQGYPFYWKVYKGNTPDVSTMQDFIDNLTRLFGMTDFVLVFDRGNVSEDNIKYIKEKQYRFISAIDKNEMAASTPVDTMQFFGIDGSNIESLPMFTQYDEDLWYRTYAQGEARYIISFSPGKQAEERCARKRKIDRFALGVKEINDGLKKAKRNRKLETTVQAVSGLLKRYNPNSHQKM